MNRNKLLIALLTITALLTATQMVSAVPAEPRTHNLTQPDGSIIQAKLVGDERFYVWETTNGYTILKNKDGYWAYAIKKDGKLVPSSYVVGKSNMNKYGAKEYDISQNSYDLTRLNIQKHLRPDKDVIEQNTFKSLSSSISTQTNYPLKSSAQLTPSLINGTQKAIVILIEFQDVKHNPNNTPAYYENMLFNKSNNLSMNRYYNEVSYGKVDVVGNVTYVWVTSQYNMSYYWDDYYWYIDAKNGPIYELAREAVQLADPYINFSQYDTDGDTIVDHLIIIHAGYGQEFSGNSSDIWSHRWVIPNCTTDDGVSAYGYTMQSEYSPMGTFAHEFGHDLGLPDLYDKDGSSSGIGKWGLMGAGSWLGNPSGTYPAHLCAWSKYLLGWVSPISINGTQHIEIPAVELNDTVYMLLDNPFGPTDWDMFGNGVGEYFLIENRQKIGFDSYLPGEGLLIWHVDESEPGNYNETHYLVDLEEADGYQELENGYDRGSSTDPWYSNLTGFTDVSNPNSNLYDGTNSGVRVTNISDSSVTMTADLTVSSNITNTSTGPTYINMLPYVIDTSGYYILNISSTGINSTAITITANDVVLDGNGHVLEGMGINTSSIYWEYQEGYLGYSGIDIRYCKNVTIKNLAVMNWSVGIDFYGVDNSKIENITVSSNDCGISLWGSNNNTLRNNTMNNNTYN
ncbi:M6 family metalloprotease domain-containing protein, partial [Methanothermococcus thermolithotrophicus]